MNFKACNIVSAPFLQAFPNPGKAPFLSGTCALCGKVTKISHILPTLFDKCFRFIRQTDVTGAAHRGAGFQPAGYILKPLVTNIKQISRCVRPNPFYYTSTRSPRAGKPAPLSYLDDSTCLTDGSMPIQTASASPCRSCSLLVTRAFQHAGMWGRSCFFPCISQIDKNTY